MNRKKVWRYYCEFCKKSNCSGASISTHERSCTNNPNRICRMHVHCDDPQIPLAELMVPLFASSKTRDYKAATEALRKLASGCPACMLAAIRQSGLQQVDYDPESDNLGPDFGFDFKKELAEFWAVVNDAQYQNQTY